ncbi:biotin transporter BioY [Alkalibacter rhizosphaerae]|uniref:Biotin transporter n=1 Tax=Alkalibacter rhizosphaerae TaxID=2815577 RepID=A0A974XGY1_9FIRM|nr:biotin transporter BioY [Alkalibacter rhizosphaerae]QSX09581.1 biotin transporter BioY [Alkalibacter rhizosphaerae]
MKKNILPSKVIVYCGLFTALIVVGALTRIPVPIVPFTLQLLFTTLAGMVLGPVYGSLSVVLYVLLGLMGLPVFANGGGLGYIFQPTFGYLLAFIAGTALVGHLTKDPKKRSFPRLFLAGVAGLLLVYVGGYVYYYLLATHVLGLTIVPKILFFHAFLLPLPGDLVSCVIASMIALRLPKFSPTG